MQSGNRLTRRRIGQSPDDTYIDKQDAGDGSQLTKVLSALTIGAGVYGAYRKGWLKPFVKQGTELMETIAKGTTDKAYQVSNILKKWSKDSLHAPSNSMFRRNTLDNFKLITDALRDSSTVRSTQLKSMIDDTVDDLKYLKEELDKVNMSLTDRTLNYKNTTIARTLSEMRTVSREMNTNLNGNWDKISNAQREMFKEMMSNKKTYLSLEDEVLQMKRNGMRNLTLKDIMEAPIIDDEGKIIFKAKDGFEDMLEEANFGKSNLMQLEDLVMGGQRSQYRFASNGRVTSGIGDWETFGRLKVDSHMYIDETGRLVDIRIGSDMIRDLKRSLATDFVIPGLQFNPIATLTGWGRSNHEAMFGMIDAKSFQPLITKMAGRVEAGTVLNNEHGFFAGDKLFRFRENVAEKIGEGFEFYDVSKANSFGLNSKLKGTAKIADLNTPEFIEKENRKHKEFVDNVYEKLRLSREIKTKEKFNPDGTRVINSNPLIDDMDDEKISFIMHPFLFLERKVTEPFIERLSPYKQSVNISPADVYNSHLKATVNDITQFQKEARQFVAMKKGTDFKDILEGDGITGRIGFIKDVFRETLQGGRYTDGSLRNLTTNTLSLYNLFDSVMDRLGNIAPMLRFENKYKGNTLQYLGNVLVYRAAPIYMALQVPGMVNAMSEPIFGILGFNHKNKKEDKYNDNNMNLGKFIMGGVKQVDLAFHNVKDAVGLTNIFKAVEEYLPAADQINELPGVYQLGLGQTKEERKDYIEKGFDPVRKARYWSMGNNMFTGGKINYWRPNFYRRVAADVDFSDSKWGSRQEYYSNTWIPNPVNPLAPLNKLLNPNHYDYKHYYDRPYLMTAPVGENIPIIGHLVAGTIGSVTQHKMHPEYWTNGHPVEKHDETPPELAEAQYNSAWTGEYDLTTGPIQSRGGGIAGIAMDMSAMTKVSELKSKPGSFILRKISEFLNADQLAQEAVMIQDLQNVRNQMQRGSVNVHDILNEQIPIAKTRSIGGTVKASILPSETDNRFSTYTSQFQYEYQGNNPGQYELYTTPSGGMSVVDVPANLDLWTANVGVSNFAISKLYGTKQRVAVNDPNRFEPQLQDYSKIKFNNRFLYQMGEEYNTLTDLAGMKGYEFRTFVTGDANQNTKQLETSSYAYSFNKSFWDENLGGILGLGEGGEESSELFRRFVQKRNRSTDYIDPVRNTMPSWMPGRNYFTDFKHGDPYSKIENGEERLPGEGYERLYGINQEQMFNLSIGSSYIGKTKDEMVKHLLGDKEIDVDSLEIPSKFTGKGDSAAISGTKLHEKIERSWVDTGLAINTEGEFYDEKHNIKGFYDALIHDPLSRTGRAIVDIKTVNNEKFQAVAESGQPLYEHQSQVNYYLYATDNRFSNGYVYYVNRDNPTQRMTVGFRYNPELLRENLETLKNARNTIYEGLQKGTIGRGELYSNLDRYRILADVAPYSDEFKDAKAAVSFDDSLTPEEKEEVSEINKRVTEQKKPLRLYPYKFSNAKDTITETVRVKEIVDNNHILVNQYGVDHSISLAGVRVSQSNTDMYDEERTMNEAAREELEKYFRKGQRIQITYDARENKKFNKDTTSSIKASVVSKGTNVNRRMINKGFGKEKDDESPAAMRAKYNNSQLAVGSVLEKMTHTFAQIPFVGNKWLQAKSPYEQYRDREVYGKIY